jgi:hypothetical protein
MLFYHAGEATNSMIYIVLGLLLVSPVLVLPILDLSYQQYIMGAGYVMVLGLNSTSFSSNLLIRSEQ